MYGLVHNLYNKASPHQRVYTHHTRLKDQFKQKWQSELKSMTTWDVKSLKWKSFLLFENQKYRRSIRNFRLNTSGIPEVTGRYEGLGRKHWR